VTSLLVERPTGPEARHQPPRVGSCIPEKDARLIAAVLLVLLAAPAELAIDPPTDESQHVP
jgi:hypothetical protein